MLILIKAVLLASMVQFLSGTSKAQLQWRRIDTDNSTSRPSARQNAALGFDEEANRLVLFGGRSTFRQSNIILGDTWIFDLSTKIWRELTPQTMPSARYGTVYGVSNGYFYVSMGQGPNGIVHRDIWRFELNSETWELLPAQGRPSYITKSDWNALSRTAFEPEARHDAVGGIYPGAERFFISQGFSQNLLGETYSYDTNSEVNGWYIESLGSHPYSPSYPHARYLHSGAMVGPDELLIHGGCLSGGKSGGPCPSSDSWLYNAKEKKWRELNSCASARTNGAIAILPPARGQRRAVLYGGLETGSQVLKAIQSNPDQVGIFNPDNLKWELKVTNGDVPSKRASVAMVTSKTGIFMFGGIETESELLLDDLHELIGTALDADQAAIVSECGPTFFNLLMLHGVLMGAGWGVFLLWGAFIGRYLKRRPHWLPFHVLFQVFGLLLSIAGLVCGIMSVRSDHFSFLHAIIGLVVMIVGIIQPIIALLRPKSSNSSETKKLRRLVWEFIHHWVGYLALIFAIVNISLGVFLAQVSFYVWLGWFIYLGCVSAFFLSAEISRSWLIHRDGEPYITTENTINNLQNKRDFSEYEAFRNQGYRNTTLNNS